MSIKETTMIVNLSISQWSARKFDAKATREVEENHQTKEAGRFNKILLKSNTLKEISSIASKLRQYHYENTLPWGDNGDRLLPTKNYFNYVMETGKFKYEMTPLVEKFINEYVEEKEHAKQRLNTLYNESDYPPVDRIRDKFKVHISFFPIADNDDLRINMSQEIIGAMKANIQNEIGNRIDKAVDDMLERLRNVIRKMIEALSEEDKTFRDSLVGNIREVTEFLPVLNFNNDKKVDEAIKLSKQLLVSPDMLRDNKQYRKEILGKARSILNSI